MKDIPSWALDTAAQRGASYADARIADDRSRALSTKNGKVGGAYWISESFGHRRPRDCGRRLGIRRLRRFEP